MNHVCLNCG